MKTSLLIIGASDNLWVVIGCEYNQFVTIELVAGAERRQLLEEGIPFCSLL